MKRLHLFEIHEKSWCPAVIRDGMTDYLQAMERVFDLYGRIAPILVDALRRCRTTRIVDLCAGAGGPWKSLMPRLTSELEGLSITLTDKYPNESAYHALKARYPAIVDYCLDQVDATAVQGELTGFRTLFGSFHHFKPADAKAILRNALQHRQGIGIFEISERTLPSALMELGGSATILLMAPFVRPFRATRTLLTYLPPVIPVFNAFDGVVSCLRTYSVSELQEMVADLESDRYQWQIGQLRSPLVFMNVTYLIGTPL